MVEAEVFQAASLKLGLHPEGSGSSWQHLLSRGTVARQDCVAQWRLQIGVWSLGGGLGLSEKH